MKSKFNLLIVFFTLACLGAYAGGEEFSKTINKEYPVNQVNTLEVINKYGDVKIADEGGSDVTIDVIITVETPNENKANELLSQIDVNFSHSGGKLTAETRIDKDFRSKDRFSIDYTINIPPSKNLVINNRYGNIAIKELNAEGTFTVKYGNLSAGKLTNPQDNDINIDLSYGKAEIDEISDASLVNSYSKFYLGTIGNLDVESKYSVMEIDQLDRLSAESKYDVIKLGKVARFNGSARYTKIEIEELSSVFDLTNGYGGVDIISVNSALETIRIENEYASVSLGLPSSLTYELDAECTYCGVKYNDEQFKGNRQEEKQTISIDGTVGTGTPTAKVYLRSKYGSIKLK